MNQVKITPESAHSFGTIMPSSKLTLLTSNQPSFLSSGAPLAPHYMETMPTIWTWNQVPLGSQNCHYKRRCLFWRDDRLSTHL